ncbi:MobF family relaxase [Isoptericola sp. NPDC019482]|uniref:MobF family relaxase n=1 Tax=Isoptericola sp. NPDC019482 TaxID=3154688 RepID=UPI0034796CA1
MTVSLRVMTAGKGYEYLLRSVVTGDGNRSLTTPLTRYYLDEGTPPGYWLGAGVTELGDGALAQGDVVTARQLEELLGAGHDPVSGKALGRPFPTYVSVADRIADRVDRLPTTLDEGERADAVAAITAQETAKGTRTAVAGYDLTFSVTKSVSVLWALSDAETQARIAAIHHAAVAAVIGLFEREVAATRSGSDSCVQEAVVGVAATAFDHYDSRANDPQLHTHVVVSNKVKTVRDGRWRSLDSRPVHAATVALSEYYNAVLADRLTAEFGVDWERRLRGADRSPQWEIAGVGDGLIAEFSSRTRLIEQAKNRMIADYVATHGRQPSRAGIIRMRAQATLDTRAEKQIHSLADLTAGWRGRARHLLGVDPTVWARRVIAGPPQRALSADRVPDDMVDDVALRVLEVVGERRATWRHWNLWAEASRQTMGWRFATTADRESVVAAITSAAERRSVPLTPPDSTTTPEVLRRPDGSNMFRSRHGAYFTSEAILDAEQRLLDRGATRTAPALADEVVDVVVGRGSEGDGLSAEQLRALAWVATSGRQVDLLVGPAGAGKTTAMSALRRAWAAQYGPGSVVGLAPSAAAAKVLAGDLQIGCDNTAKWLHEHDHGRADFTAGQLVIVDEATLAPTRALDRITGLASVAGAKVLLVGDHAQLQAVDAGGAFSMLREARDGVVPQLTEVHRFANEWEKHASLDLRAGRVEVVEDYIAHDRVRAGTTTEMVDAAYLAWRADAGSGMRTLLVTDSTDHVRDLNERARAERLCDGDTLPDREAALAGDARASAGDLVVTRRNDRRLRTPRGGWVRNGDRWRVVDVRRSGGLEVRREGVRRGGSVVLPAAYVREHVDLGYAVTAHRAQGMTVDTCHVVVAGATSRENLYVAMSRGRDTNTAYVALDRPDDLHAHPVDGRVTARGVLASVLARSGVELSAHESRQAERERYASIAQLAAEYEAIATLAQRDRWEHLVGTALTTHAGLTAHDVEAIVADDAFGPLCGELRRIEANGGDVAHVLAHVVAGRGFGDAANIASVLTWRLQAAVAQPIDADETGLIAGLLPQVCGLVDPETRRALDERTARIVERARAVAARAVRDREPWLHDLGDEPYDKAGRRAWRDQVAVVAAYRDRYGLRGARAAVGGEVATVTQQRDQRRARAAVEAARTVAHRAPAGVGAQPADGPALG